MLNRIHSRIMNSRPISENPVTLFRTSVMVAKGGYRCVWGYKHPNEGQYSFEPNPGGPSLPPLAPPDWVNETTKEEYIVVSETSEYFWSGPASSEAYLDFEQLAPERDAIISFANSHGWLGFSDCIHAPEVDPVKAGCLGASIPVRHNGTTRSEISYRYVVHGESLSRWKLEIEDYRAHFGLWRAVKNKDIRQLSKVVRRHRNGNFTFRWGRSKGNISERNPDFDIHKFPPNSLIEPAKALVIQRINTKLNDTVLVGVRFTETARDPFRVEPYVVAKTLLASIWLQFSALLTGVRAYKACAICGRPMDVSECARMGSKRVHTSCSNRTRMARYRHKLAALKDETKP